MKWNVWMIVSVAVLLIACRSVARKESVMDGFKLEPFSVDYLRAVDELRVKYGLSEDEANGRIMRIHFPEKTFLKSGLGGLGGLPYPDRVVQTKLSVNNITLDAKTGKRWLGSSLSVPEIVVLEGDEVVCAKPSSSASGRDYTIVLFTPERVEYFGWSRFEGGSFKRNPAQ